MTDEQLRAIIKKVRIWQYTDDDATEEIMDLFTKYSQTIEREARIDELAKVKDIIDGEYDPMGWYPELEERIESLRQGGV
jgi:hypothetical protein